MSAVKKMLIAFCIVAIFVYLGVAAYTAKKSIEKCIKSAKYKTYQTVIFRGTKVIVLSVGRDGAVCLYGVRIDGKFDYINMNTLENESIKSND